MLCSYQYKKILTCRQGEPLLTAAAGYCATYNDHTKLVSILECPFFESNGYNYASQGLVLLPNNLSELNDYMCGPLNRKGLVCSECADGFGPSVTSFGYRCVKCKDVWNRVPLFLTLSNHYPLSCHFSASNPSHITTYALLNYVRPVHTDCF